jgi:phosphate transport system substrate-binding protein
MQRLAVTLLLAFAVFLPSWHPRDGQASAWMKETLTAERINGGGSSFVKPLMDKWTAEYARRTGVEVNYQSVGSGAGMEKMIAREFDFGCSDAPLKRSQMAKAREVGGEVLHVPIILGGVVPAYNLPGVSVPLRFDGAVLAEIFLGRLTRWDDSRLAALNPDVKLPGQEIVVVRRADGSGTTFIWSDFLYRSSPAWRERMGRDTQLRWADSTIGAKGTEGVTQTIESRVGALGYIELTFAVQNGLAFGALKNQAGQFIRADLKSITIAAENLTDRIPETFRFSLVDAPGEGAYPAAGVVFALIYTRGGPQSRRVLEFLEWVTGPEGQRLATQLDYAPLPSRLSERVRAALARLK